jgi:hypothetical protein
MRKRLIIPPTPKVRHFRRELAETFDAVAVVESALEKTESPVESALGAGVPSILAFNPTGRTIPHG